MPQITLREAHKLPSSLLIFLTVLLISEAAYAVPLAGKEMMEIGSIPKFYALSETDQVASIKTLLIIKKDWSEEQKDERSIKLRACSIEEGKKPEYATFDMATVVVKCLFKLEYN